MALDTQEVTIDQTHYRITQLPFTKANKLLVRLVKTLGPALASAVDRMPATGKQGAILALKGNLGEFGESFSSAAELLCEKLTEEDLADTFSILAESCEVSFDKQSWQKLQSVMEIQFSGGNMMHAMKWLFEALKVNYGNFFDALLSRGGDLLEEAKGAATE